jgi:SNF2 family DNA or RNA helicase
MAPNALILDVKDYAKNLPPLLFPVRYFRLPAKAQKAYDTAEEEMFLNLEDFEYECKNSGAKDTMLRQLASGNLYEPQPETARPLPADQRPFARIHTAKLDALLGLIDELQGAPLLIVYNFRHSLKTLRKALFSRNGHQTVPYIGQGVTPAQGVRIEQDWRADKLPLLLLHPLSAAYGLNLQGGAGVNLVWYDLTWQHALYVQQYFRLWRRGVTNTVVIHHLIAERTIEELMMARLDSRAAQEQDFKSSVQQYWLQKYGKVLATPVR